MTALPKLPEHLFFRVQEDYNRRGQKIMYVLLMWRKKGRFWTRNIELDRERMFRLRDDYRIRQESEAALADTAQELYARYTTRTDRHNRRERLKGDYPPKTL